METQHGKISLCELIRNYGPGFNHLLHQHNRLWPGDKPFRRIGVTALSLVACSFSNETIGMLLL
jgi:hypothetical protein